MHGHFMLFVFSTLNSRFQCNLFCRDVPAVLKCAVSIHIYSLDAASVLLTLQRAWSGLAFGLYLHGIIMVIQDKSLLLLLLSHSAAHTNIFQ